MEPVFAGGDEVDRIVRTAAVLAAAAAFALALIHLLNVALRDGEVLQLHADMERNAWAWAGSVTIFGAALAAFLPTVTEAAVDLSGLALAVIFAFFSLDEAISLHERIAERSVDLVGARVSFERVIWPLVFLPLLAATFLLLLRLAKSAPKSVRVGLVGGLGLLGAAVFMEVTSGAYLEAGSENTWKDAIEVALEEGAELAGWILIAGALTARAYLLARGTAR
jgi:hypothetical protein